MAKQTKRESLDFSTVIRLPDELANKLKALAVKNNRSLNSEFIEIFKATLHHGKDIGGIQPAGGTDAMLETAQTYRKDVFTIGIIDRLIQPNTLMDINPDSLERYKALRKDQGKKEATINRDLGLFKAMMNRAVEWGYFVRSPVKSVKKLREPRNRPQCFTLPQIKTPGPGEPRLSRIIVVLG